MKRLMLVVLFFGTLSAHADLEHIPGQGAMPKSQKLSAARSCFHEIDNMGCGHPRDDQEFFNGCLEEKRDELTLSCQAFFEKLYGKKKSS